GGGTVTPGNVCNDVAKRKCDFEIRCKSDVADQQGRPTTDAIAASERAACEAQATNDPNCTVGAAGWDAGRAVLDAAKYGACIDAAYPAGTCVRDLNAVLTACANAP